MNALQGFYEISNQLIHLLQQDNLDRDVRIENIQNLLGQREALLGAIQPPFSQEEQELGNKLVEQNQQVEQLLQKQKQEIQQDIKRLHLQKESNQKYMNPYESLSIDGVFYDKRK